MASTRLAPSRSSDACSVGDSDNAEATPFDLTAKPQAERQSLGIGPTDVGAKVSKVDKAKFVTNAT